MKRGSAEFRSGNGAHLKLDAPHVVGDAAPQGIEPCQVAGLADLGGLVVQAQNNVALTEAEGLHLSILAVLRILAGQRDKAILVEVEGGQLEVEREVHP